MANTEDGPTVIESKENNGGDSTNVGDEDYNKKIATLFDGILKKLKPLADDKNVNKIEKALVTNITSDLSIVKDVVAELCSKKYIEENVEGKVDSIGKEVNGVIDYMKEKKGDEKREKLNKIEKDLVTNMTSIVAEFCTENEMKEDVKGKVDNIRKEVDWVIKYLKEKEEQKGNIDEEKNNKMMMVREQASRLKWWHYISNKSEKIKSLVSQFGSLDEDASSSSNSKKQRQKTLSNTMECHDMCIEESLLISPIIMASLKKSYHHLPPELRLCLLSLSAFPENFIIKKRPLIYWWMAEGFVVATSSSKSSSVEEVGEEKFGQLIQLGLIQPWYEAGNNTTQTQFFPHVQGCVVHPWIRKTLVSIAMEAQLLEFYGKVQHHPRSPRMCLYEGVEHSGIWKAKKLKYDNFRERWKWAKAQALLEQNQKESRHKEFSKMPRDVNEVYDRQKKLRNMFDKATKRQTQLNDLVFDVSYERIKHWSQHDALNQRIDNLMATIILQMKQKDVGDDMQNVNKLHVEQMEQLNDVEGLHKHVQVQLHYLDRLLAIHPHPEVNERPNNCETLQNSELLFRHYDLTNQFPFPIKKRTTSSGSDEKRASDGSNDDNDVHHAEKLLAIINVSQSYLDRELELFGKMKRLRTLHLGRWQDCLPVPHIELENTKIFEALFRVAKHLKYLSLRGISRITELPKNISNCSNLQILDLKACYNLEKLPSQISSLSKLTHFDVSECYLLQTNLWSIVQSLQSLQTLKGLKVVKSYLTSFECLRKLSIILTTTKLRIDFSSGFSNLRVLTITWRTENLLLGKNDDRVANNTQNPPPQQPEKSDGEASTENPPPQQPEKTEDGGAGTENQQQPNSEKSEDGGANNENLQQPNSGKSNGGASIGNPKQDRSDEVKGIETLEQLNKLDLRCYPYKAWPHWLKKHDSLETLYITGGNIEEFPTDDLHLPNLKVLRLKYLNHLSKSQVQETKFPSLTHYLYIKSPNS